MICAYTEKRWTELERAVASVQGQTLCPNEIIIVVDHNPGLYRRVCAWLAGCSLPEIQQPDVIAVENAGMRGLSDARNSGIAAARGEWIAFLDEDAVGALDWLAQLSAAYGMPNVLGVGGAIEPQWQGARPTWFPEEFDWVVGCTYRGMPQRAEPVRNLIGCNMSFRREVFDVLGGFQKGIGRIGTLPLGCEETELCIRVRQKWARSVLVYEPHAKVYHIVTPARTRLNYFFARCYAEGLSKAQVAQLRGESDALESERTYTRRTLPQGVLRNLGNAVSRKKPDGLLRAGAIVAGLGVTTAGYVRGKLRQAAAESGLGCEFTRMNAEKENAN